MNDAQKIVANEVKRFLNFRPMTCMWHNGTVDQGCEFHGLHLHVVMQSAYKIIDSSYCKRLKKKLAAYGISVRTQKVNKALAILAHLQKEPRVLVGSNNLILCAKLIQTKGKNDDPNIDFSLQDLQEMGNYFDEKLKVHSNKTTYSTLSQCHY